MRVQDILETCLYVDDLHQAEQFYAQCLGLELFSRQEGRHIFFRCGHRMLLIFYPEESARDTSELPPHGTRGPGHVAFAVAESELPQWQRHLQHCGVLVEKVMDWPQGGRSLYFRDPAGNSVELATPKIWGIDESQAACR